MSQGRDTKQRPKTKKTDKHKDQDKKTDRDEVRDIEKGGERQTETKKLETKKEQK